jgi:hypothetical protein
LPDAPISEEGNHSHHNKEKRTSMKIQYRHSDKALYNNNDNKGYNNQYSNNNINIRINYSDKFLPRVQTFQQPFAYYPSIGQNGLPQMGMAQINSQQQPMMQYATYGVPMAYTYTGNYQNNLVRAKSNQINNIQKPNSNKSLTSRYYLRNNNKIKDEDDEYSIQ